MKERKNEMKNVFMVLVFVYLKQYQDHQHG